ncbi:MAG TPA: KpsF/GutQ family sugar-phosphate isomerase [Ignavibacteriaceae bacterium]|jgi:arabinose-5-phosphate isomerase|nr:KpsF/GutQ family sugar-phosphate isomerase [Ignavibacteriaceae bacterium]HOJ19290.1 KpsF/GutQ family sugar-phosphate isomerase [Ignavibacteriaceae bacterium]
MDIKIKGRQVVEIEAKAVAGLSRMINDEFEKAVKLIIECKGRVVLTGMGKSGLIARKIVATMNSTGTAAIFLHPTDALHGDLGMVRRDDVVIILSKSGNTEEVINLVPMIQRLHVPIIGIMSNRNSKLGSEADIVLEMGITEEACPLDLAPTSSTTAMLALGDALAVCLLELRGFTQEDFAQLHPGGSLGKRLSLRIKEIMIKGDKVPVVREETSFKETIFEITSKRLGMTCVVDEENKLTGIITDGDLRRLLEKSQDLNGIKAGEMMTSKPKTISPDLLASFALQQMERFKITALVVAEEKNIKGVVHLHDLINLGLERR